MFLYTFVRCKRLLNPCLFMLTSIGEDVRSKEIHLMLDDRHQWHYFVLENKEESYNCNIQLWIWVSSHFWLLEVIKLNAQVFWEMAKKKLGRRMRGSSNLLNYSPTALQRLSWYISCRDRTSCSTVLRIETRTWEQNKFAEGFRKKCSCNGCKTQYRCQNQDSKEFGDWVKDTGALL